MVGPQSDTHHGARRRGGPCPDLRSHVAAFARGTAEGAGADAGDAVENLAEVVRVGEAQGVGDLLDGPGGVEQLLSGQVDALLVGILAQRGAHLAGEEAGEVVGRYADGRRQVGQSRRSAGTLGDDLADAGDGGVLSVSGGGGLGELFEGVADEGEQATARLGVVGPGLLDEPACVGGAGHGQAAELHPCDELIPFTACEACEVDAQGARLEDEPEEAVGLARLTGAFAVRHVGAQDQPVAGSRLVDAVADADMRPAVEHQSQLRPGVAVAAQPAGQSLRAVEIDGREASASAGPRGDRLAVEHGGGAEGGQAREHPRADGVFELCDVAGHG